MEGHVRKDAGGVPSSTDARLASVENDLQQTKQQLRELRALLPDGGDQSPQRRQSVLPKAGKWRLLPNFYRRINETHDGFDPSLAHVESMVSCAIICITIILVAVLVGYYAGHKFTDATETRHPSLQEYRDTLTKNNLVTHPLCECGESLVPHGTAYGGFVPEVDWELDPMCNNSLSVYSGYTSAFDNPSDYFVNISMIPGTPQSAEVRGYACPRVRVNGVWETSEGALRDYHAGNCGLSGLIVDLMLGQLEELCDIANNSNTVAVEDWLITLMATEFLHTESTLLHQISRSLTQLTTRTGLTLNPTVQTTLAVQVMEDPAKAAFQILGDTFEYDVLWRGSCTGAFYFGSFDNQTESMKAFITQCDVNQVWTGQCCETVTLQGQASQQRCGPVLEFDCTPSMIVFSRRLTASSYASIEQASFSSFLRNGDSASRTSHVTERSHTSSVGFHLPEQVRQDGTILFNDYYHLCAPTTCEWTEESDTFYALVLVISGLIGGVATALRLSGFCCTCVAKQVVVSRSQSEVQHYDSRRQETAPIGKVDVQPYTAAAVESIPGVPGV
mmetsp:Transcript_43112/g.99306  ORF Transcript_43112/g.99306 Transcript_43112/m.99306 type:complete len:560 (-) Transcript_43112:247-1926(-)